MNQPYQTLDDLYRQVNRAKRRKKIIQNALGYTAMGAFSLFFVLMLGRLFGLV